MNKVILHKSDLDDYLTKEDKKNIEDIERMYMSSLSLSDRIEAQYGDAISKLVDIHRAI